METIPVKIPDITTARLRLVAMTPEMLDADASDARRLERMLQARVPAEWPDENWGGACVRVSAQADGRVSGDGGLGAVCGFAGAMRC